MITKQRIKLIHSLELKKNRDTQNLFIGEGTKTVCSLIHHFACEYIAATAEWITDNLQQLPQGINIDTISSEDLKKASLQKTPQGIIAIFKKKQEQHFTYDQISTNLCLALDSIQDPGNLGTIIRIANWFGIKKIICSDTTADIYSPKVIQATMGAIAGIDIYYTDLSHFLAKTPASIPIYGTFLEGDNIFHSQLSSNGIIVMGNEGNGISTEVASHITKKLFIPPYHTDSSTTESLNVGVATAITCAEFRRRLL